MRRTSRAVIVSVLLATCLAFISQSSSRVSAAAVSSTAFAHARAWIAKSIEAAPSRVPVLRRVARPARLAQSAGDTSTPTDAWVRTDKWDYQPGETAQISGGGFQPGESVMLQVVHTNPDSYDPDKSAHLPWPVAADSSGGIQSIWFVDPIDSLGEEYLLTADGLSSGLHAEYHFTDANPSADLDQCANDKFPSPSTDGCSASENDWVNGNVNESKANYFEGDSLPYRMLFDHLTVGTVPTGPIHTVIIKWDTTKGDKHALDYLTTYNTTVTTADPCLGVSGCGGTPSTFPIAKDGQVDDGTGVPITQPAGMFTMWGGTITSTDVYTYPNGTGFDGDKSASIAINFIVTVPNPVLAWAGHIATRLDWGSNNSAVTISGSPYHTALVDLDGAGGSQDRSLSADAVIFPGSITIVKDAQPEGSTSFAFTASPTPLSNFNLVDDSSTTDTKVFSNITNFQSYSIGETSLSGWTLSSIACVVSSPNGGSQTVSSPSVSINLKEGENVSCTFSNQQDFGSLKISKSFNALTSGFSGSFSIAYDCNDGTTHDGTVSLTAGTFQVIGSIPIGTTCVVSEPTLPSAPTGWTFGTPTLSDSQAATDDGTVVITAKNTTYEVTVTNTITRDKGYLKISKVFDPLTSGFVGTFAIKYNCGAGDVTVNLAAGGNTTVGPFDTGTSCAVTEPTLPTAPTGWTFGTPSISGSPATITKGDAAAAVGVTVTNSISRDLGNLRITKTVVGGSSGFTGSFSVDVICGGDGGTYLDRIINYPSPGAITIANIPTGNTCTVTEDSPTGAPTGYTWGTASITNSPATISKGAITDVTVTNTVTGRAKVIKTKAGLSLVSGDAFTFQLRTGASTTVLGNIVETLIATASNLGVLNFTTVLTPGNHYQMCELVMPGWNTSLTGPLFVPGSIIPPTLPNPNVDNSPVCVDFVAQAGVTTTFTVDNTFPGGLARTIGFWKNWASCNNSNGNQKPVLDQTLATAVAANAGLGVVVSAQSGTWAAFAPTRYLVLNATGCVSAVNLLNKSTVSSGKKMANDPAFNLAAQLLAAELNFFAGAGQNGTAINAVNQAVLLLGRYQFKDNGYTGKISAADATTMNNLATILDNYNNNRP
jgi:hypothetical protein